MTLYKQMLIGWWVMVAALAVLTFGVVHRHLGDDTQRRVEQQLQNDAQSAAMLITSHPQVRAVASVLKPLIDRWEKGGDIAIVRLIGRNNKVVWEKRLRQTGMDNAVPILFQKLFALTPVRVSKRVPLSGQEMRIELTESLAKRYMTAWHGFVEFVTVFLAAGGVMSLMLYLFSRRIVSALKALRKQAEAIAQKRTAVQKHSMAFRELKEVAEAMNTVAFKVQEVYRKEARAVARYNEILYKDRETGFYNRDYFRIKLTSFLKGKDRFSYGYILGIQLHDYVRMRQESGAQGVHEGLMKVRRAIVDVAGVFYDAVLCRTREEEFLLILPTLRHEEVEQIGREIVQRCQTFMLDVHMAIVGYRAGEKPEDVLSRIDTALMAVAGGEGACQLYSAADALSQVLPPLSHKAWKETLLQAIQERKIEPYFQPVYNRKEEIVHEEVLMRLHYEEQTYTAGEILPIANVLGISDKLDKYMIETVITEGMARRVAFNLSYEFVEKTENIQWLREMRRTRFRDDTKVAFEIANPTVARHAETVKAFAAMAREEGWLFGIDHFTVDAYDMELLQEMRPHYIKLNGRYLLTLLDEEEGACVASFKIITSLLQTQLIATEVEDTRMLERLFRHEVYAVQGYGMHKPYHKEEFNELSLR